MDDKLKSAIKEKVKAFVEIQEAYITLGIERQILLDKMSRIKSELFEDGPRECAEEAFAHLRSRKNVFGLVVDKGLGCSAPEKMLQLKGFDKRPLPLRGKKEGLWW